MTLTGIIIPRWISWDSETVRSHPPSLRLHTPTDTLLPQPSGERIHYTYGLHRRCSSLTNKCDSFPQQTDCQNGDRYFCSMWRSVGFLMSFAVVIEGMTLIAYVVILGGGKQKRETGWKILSGLHVLVGALECASMAIIVSVALAGAGRKDAVRLTICSIGISLRQRRPLLPRVEIRYILDRMHRQLECHVPASRRNQRYSTTSTVGRRLRANTWRRLGTRRTTV